MQPRLGSQDVLVQPSYFIPAIPNLSGIHQLTKIPSHVGSGYYKSQSLLLKRRHIYRYLGCYESFEDKSMLSAIAAYSSVTEAI